MTAAPVPADVLRTALGLFATGVTVACARDPHTGEVRAMTANAFMAGSLRPPLVVLGVRREARLHPVIVAAGGYGVSVVARRQEAAARYFAGMSDPSRPPPARFAELAGVPVLAGAVATIATRLEAAHEVGDHTLFVGAVTAVDATGAALPVLAYHRSHFARVSPLPAEDAVPVDPWEGRGGDDPAPPRG